MAAPLPHTIHGEIACPDPSMHEKQNRLSEQASTAALYVTQPERNNHPRDTASQGDILGPDGRLSAKSAAASLKYARAQDLPSFPTVGINNTSDSAGKAALLANDYKMKDLWHPELSSAGSKAALVAARGSGKLDLWQPSPTKEGNSAATLAMRNKGLSPQIDYGYTSDGKQRALQAATLSVGRSRSDSTPIPVAHPAYPDSENSAKNALNAATVSHRANSVKAAPDGWDSEANQAARIKNLNKKIDPEMFGEHPPWKDEEEDKHQAALRASAVSMAKQMYEYKNRTVLTADLTGGVQGAEAAAARQTPSSQVDIKQEALRYIHLQDAAHKLAQERLAKVDRNFEAARYREYYGYPDNKQETSPRKPMHRLSIRGRGHRRAASEGGELDDSDDEEQARRIRGQMSQLGSHLSNVDEKKRSDDRAKLLAAAEKRVHARLHDMDEKVFADTGKVTPAMMEEWEAKARKRQQEEKESAAQHPGMTHIGGGKFIAQSEIEAIAAARLKPTLDEIDATAQKRRARDEEMRQEREENEREKREGKQKNRDEKEELKRVKNEEKVAARKEKDEAKVRREEEKRIAKDDKRKSREVKREDVAETGGVATVGAAAQSAPEDHEDSPGYQNVNFQKGEKKRDGALGRWASKLRRSKKPEQSKAAEQKAESEHATAAVDSALVGGTAGVAGAVDAAHENHVDDEDRQVSDLEDDDDDDVFREPEDTRGTQVSAIEPSVEAADSLAVPGKALKPNLERHISTIRDSDDEDDEDDEGDEDEAEHERGNLGNDRARELAHRVISAPDDSWAATEGTSKVAVDDQHQIGSDAVAAGGAAAVADPSAHTATHTDDTETEATARSVWDHDNDLARIRDPRVQPGSEPTGQPAGSNPTTAPAAPASEPATAAIGGEANQKRVEREAGGNSLDTGSDAPYITHPEKDDMNKGGLVGLFNLFRGAHKRPEQRVPKPEEYKEKASGDVPRNSAGGGSAEKADGSGALSDEVGHEPDSPSSFARGEGALKDIDDVSSSGAEEEDLGRGRSGGPLAGNFMSLGKSSGTTPLTTSGAGMTKQRSGTTNDDEHFEEARDHFDESLAPPPAFAGQEKNASPVRGTRFKENLLCLM